MDDALERAFRRLALFEDRIDKLAWHGIKVIVSFAMLERRSLPDADFAAFVRSLPFALDVNSRYLGLDDELLAERIRRELLLVGALREQDGHLCAG